MMGVIEEPTDLGYFGGMILALFQSACCHSKTW